MTDAIQLSKLPPPDVVEVLDAETLLANAKARLKNLWPAYDAEVESDPLQKLLEVLAYVVMVERQRKNDDARACFIATAVKNDLDNLVAFLGVERLTLTPAQSALGIDAVKEADDDLRERFTLAPAGFSVAGPDDAYRFHARSASGDVLDVGVTSPAPCEVVVSVLSWRGDGTASPELLDTVARTLNADRIRPLTDYVRVQSATIVPFTIEATLWSFAGPDPDIAMAAAQANADRYRNDCRRMGRDITLSGLYAALHVAGIQRVELTSPTADIPIDDTQAPYCASIVLHYGGIHA